VNLIYRPAAPDDVRQCIELRGKTRENAYSEQALAAIGITLDTWRDGIQEDKNPGHVCLDGPRIVGMCFFDKASGEVLVVAVLPEFEGFGIGNRLLQSTLEDIKKAGYARSFLSCNPNPASRSHGFYRHLGWTSTGTFDPYNDEILERFL